MFMYRQCLFVMAFINSFNWQPIILLRNLGYIIVIPTSSLATYEDHVIWLIQVHLCLTLGVWVGRL